MSALPPEADKKQTCRDVRFVPKADIRSAADSSLFDHLVSTRHSPNGLYGISARRPALFRLDVGRPDHLAPLLGVIGDELFEVGGREREHRAAEVGKPCLDFGIGKARVDLRVELVANASTLGV